MNTSLHIPKKLSDRLNIFLQSRKISKNKLIVKAIEEYLNKQENTQYRRDILDWSGFPELEFDLELDRDFLLPTREDIL
ncbi:MAG: hypothetical protein RLZZ171_1764 [Cyanobacteriota bacterium]|jgi:hypothetical protein